MEIRIDDGKALRIIAQILRDERKFLPTEANDLAADICRRLSVVTSAAAPERAPARVRPIEQPAVQPAVASDLAVRIVSSSEKLLHEVGRLRRDVEKLHARIEPYDDERDFAPHPARPVQGLADGLMAISEARSGVQSAEFHLNAIRAGMDSISKDAISREEMKPYLKG